MVIDFPYNGENHREKKMTGQRIMLAYKDRVAVVTLNRPRRQNAFDRAMFLELARVVNELKEKLPRAVVITGVENAFCAGFDVNPDNPWVAELIAAVETSASKPAEGLIRDLRAVSDEFASLPVPLIAAVNGLAYGGGAELAVRCDLRIMAPDAVICFSEVRLGLMPDWGGGATLAHLIGASRAADLILTARKVGADEAVALGLANRISRSGKCLEDALALAEAISKNGPRAVRSALSVIRQSRDMTLQQNLALEADLAVKLIVSGECFHGVAAFLEKREPDFPDA
jgi:enoyl-CoA hydratase